jgi:hypothetical protein
MQIKMRGMSCTAEMADVKKICGFKPAWSFVPLVVDEFGTLA